MGVSYYANTYIAVPISKNELLTNTPPINVCDNGHNYPIKDSPKFCPTCGKQVKLRTKDITNSVYADYLKENHMDEEFELHISEEVLTKETPKLTPRLLGIPKEAGDWELYQNLGFGIEIDSASDYRSSSVTALSKENISNIFEIVENVAKRLGFKNTTPMLYTQLYAS